MVGDADGVLVALEREDVKLGLGHELAGLDRHLGGFRRGKRSQVLRIGEADVVAPVDGGTVLERGCDRNFDVLGVGLGEGNEKLGRVVGVVARCGDRGLDRSDSDRRRQRLGALHADGDEIGNTRIVVRRSERIIVEVGISAQNEMVILTVGKTVDLKRILKLAGDDLDLFHPAFLGRICAYVDIALNAAVDPDAGLVQRPHVKRDGVRGHTDRLDARSGAAGDGGAFMNRAPDRLRGIGIGNFEIGIEINGLHIETGSAHAVVLRTDRPYAGIGRSTPPEVCRSTVPVYDRPYSERRGTHIIGKIGNRAIARRLAVGIGQNDRKREIARLGDVFKDEIGEVIAGRKNALQSRDAVRA